MNVITRICLTAAVIAGPLLGTLSGAADAELGRRVDKLFEVGWSTALQSRAAADEQYEQVRGIAPADPRAAYAYALIQIKQRRYAEAAKVLDNVLTADANNFGAWKAKIWLSVLTKNHAVGLVEMERLLRVLPDAAAGEQTETQRELARFLGRLIGYLEGPAAGSVAKSRFDTVQRAIVARLDEERNAIFDEGRRSVLQEFSDFTTDKTESEATAKVDAEEQRQQLLEDLDTQAARIVARRDELGPQRDKLVDEMKAELAAIESEDRPLVQQLARLDSQATIVRRELLLYGSEIGRLQLLADRERDPVIRASLLVEADRLSILASRYDLDLLALERQASVVNAQRAALQRKYQQAQAGYGVQIGRIDVELAQLQKQQRRNELDQKKAEKPTAGDTRRARVIGVQATALTTYEEFPLEAEKQRVLDMFR